MTVGGNLRLGMGDDASLAPRYARWRASRLGRITDALETRLLVELVDPKPGLCVLDVGCGDGLLVVELARQGAEVTGLDTDPAMLAAARERADAAGVEARFVPGRAETLPFADDTFDRVTASALLCLVSDRTQVLSEMARVLKPGGRLVLGDLGARSFWALIRRIRGLFGTRSWRGAHFYTIGELRRLATAARVAPIQARGSIFYPPVGWIAALMAPLDRSLGRVTTVGAAFIVLAAEKPGKVPAVDQLDRRQGAAGPRGGRVRP
jgi:ubiquinone/menaquinone biosynthesis C-methylase UbiE